MRKPATIVCCQGIKLLLLLIAGEKVFYQSDTNLGGFHKSELFSVKSTIVCCQGIKLHLMIAGEKSFLLSDTEKDKFWRVSQNCASPPLNQQLFVVRESS